MAPMKKILSIVLPSAFVVGMGLELFMVKVRVNGLNFYDVAKVSNMFT